MQSEMMSRPMFRSPQGAPQGSAPMPPAGGPPMQNPEAGIAALTSNMQGMTRQGLDQATSPEEAINAMRGNQLPIQARYAELAQIVGPEDAQATPPMVLTMVQPALMLGEGGGGIEGLMPAAAGEMPAPGGIGELMLAPPPQMAPPVQEFSGGGYVRGYALGGGAINTNALMAGLGLGGAPLSGGYNTTVPSGRGFQIGAPPPRVAQQPQQSPYAAPNRAGGAANLKKYYDEDYQAYMDILAPTDEEKKSSQRDLWFDVARRGLAMASGTNPDTGAKVTGNTASRLANAFGTLPTAYAANRREMETGAQDRARQAAAQSASGRLASERQAAYEASLKAGSREPNMIEMVTDGGESFGPFDVNTQQAAIRQIKAQYPSARPFELGEYEIPDASSGGTPDHKMLYIPGQDPQVFDIRNAVGMEDYNQARAIPGSYDANLPLNEANARSILTSPSFRPIQESLGQGLPPTPEELDVWNTMVQEVTMPRMLQTQGPDGRMTTAGSKLTPAQEVAILRARASGVKNVRVPDYLNPQLDAGNRYLNSPANPYLNEFGSNAEVSPLPAVTGSGSVVTGSGSARTNDPSQTATAQAMDLSPDTRVTGPIAWLDNVRDTVLPAITLGAIPNDREEQEVENTLTQFNEGIVVAMTAAVEGRAAEQTKEIYRKFTPDVNAFWVDPEKFIGKYESMKNRVQDDIAIGTRELNNPNGVSTARAQTIRGAIAQGEQAIIMIDAIVKRMDNQNKTAAPLTPEEQDRRRREGSALFRQAADQFITPPRSN
jgi:hypothetical protein